MRVDRRITSRTGQVLVFTIWNVEVRLRVSVFLRQTEVDHVDLVAALADAHNKVVGLDVTLPNMQNQHVALGHNEYKRLGENLETMSQGSVRSDLAQWANSGSIDSEGLDGTLTASMSARTFSVTYTP